MNSLSTLFTDMFDERQMLSALIPWARRSQRTHETTHLYAELQSQSGYTRYASHPTETRRVGVILAYQCTLESVLAAVQENVHDTHHWVLRLQYGEYSIWEYAPSTIRAVVIHNDPQFIVQSVRTALTDFLETPETRTDETRDAHTHTESHQHVLVDIALWCKGTLRGSQIVSGATRVQAAIEAGRRAARDPRFPPLSLDELSETRIEYTHMQEPALFVTRSEFRRNTFDTTVGYTARTEHETGWFLPATLNCFNAPSLAYYLSELQRQKLRHPEKKAAFFAFPVADYIESRDHTRILSLRGPVPHLTYAECSLTSSIEATYRYMQHAEHERGYVPFIFDPLSGSMRETDVVRQAFMAHVLAEFNVHGHDHRDTLAKQLYVQSKDVLTKHPDTLASVYLVSAAQQQGDTTYAASLISYIRAHDHDLLTSPLTTLQYVSFLLMYGTGDDTSKAEQLISEVCAQLFSKIQKKESFSLAEYADLMPLLTRMSEREKKPALRHTASRVLDFYLSQQLPDGSFPSQVGSRYAYTRGTGKILESIAASNLLSLEDESVQRCIAWLCAMQYTEETLYCVREEFQKAAYGGFRHDSHNASIWIDAAAHILKAFLLLSGEKTS